ncbi:Uncharacterised protein [Vibrio cholerae]|nr:Uncharacterised protein [Vibrio cholerae]
MTMSLLNAFLLSDQLISVLDLLRFLFRDVHHLWR